MATGPTRPDSIPTRRASLKNLHLVGRESQDLVLSKRGRMIVNETGKLLYEYMLNLVGVSEYGVSLESLASGRRHFPPRRTIRCCIRGHTGWSKTSRRDQRR
jgi:hypothetical protein